MKDWEETHDIEVAKAEGMMSVSYQKDGKPRYATVTKCQYDYGWSDGHGGILPGVWQRVPDVILKKDIDKRMALDLGLKAGG